MKKVFGVLALGLTFACAHTCLASPSPIGEDNPRETLSRMGLRGDLDTVAARFLSREQLCERLKKNLHGDTLDISRSSFLNENPGKIFKSLLGNKSVSRLLLNQCNFGPKFKARDL